MIDLGKWPTMRVVGKSVTPDQAGDILICTAPWFDTFPKSAGWERESREIAAEYGMPLQPVYEHGGDHGQWFRATWNSWVPSFNNWRRKHGVLEVMDLDGPCNDLITSSYRAWINWDGLVAGQFNIGKYPSEDKVAEFFQEVTDRFPYLNLAVDLISEHPDQRGRVDSRIDYSRAYRIVVHDGRIDTYEGELEQLELPDEFFRWQNSIDRMGDQGVTPERLRRAFDHLVSRR
jgi:hypothetical protein